MNAIALEQIKPFDLPSLPLSRKGELPEISAVYFSLSEQGEILYIGQAVNLKNRWLNHHRLKELVAQIHPVRVAWIEVQEESALTPLESALISHFNPSLNGKKKSHLYHPQPLADDRLAEIKVSITEIDLLKTRVSELCIALPLILKLAEAKLENKRLKTENNHFKAWRDYVLAVANLAPNNN